MKITKKELLSLLLTGTLVISTSGCIKNTIKRRTDVNKEIVYVGEINDSGLEYLYIFEIEDISNNRELYLASYDGLIKYYLLGTSSVIANKIKTGENSLIITKEINSEYGKVINAYKFKQFIPLYSQINDIYTADDIIEVFNKVKEDYDVLINKQNIKKLELIRE